MGNKISDRVDKGLTYLAVVAVILWVIGVFVVVAQADVTTAPVDNVARIKSSAGSGTGWMTGDGRMVTAKHVVNYNNDLTLFYNDGTTELVDANDIRVSTMYDLAVFPVIKEAPRKLTIYGGDVAVGTPIYVTSMPFSYTFNYRSTGIIGTKMVHIIPWLCVRLTDLHGVPGMSGGPVLNDDDEVVGVLVATAGTLVMIVDNTALIGFLQ